MVVPSGKEDLVETYAFTVDASGATTSADVDAGS